MSKSHRLPFITCEVCDKSGPAHSGGTSDEAKVTAAAGSGWVERAPGEWVCPECQESVDLDADVNQTAARIVRETTD